MAPIPKSPVQVRQTVIQAATQYIKEHGLRSFTMDELAHNLRMSKRTLYQVFSDKEDLVFHCFEAENKVRAERVAEIMAGSEDVLDVMLRVVAYEMQKFGDMRPATIEELQKFPKVVALLEKQRREQSTQGAQFFEKGVEQGLFLKGIDYTIVDSIMRNMIRNAMYEDTMREVSFNHIFRHAALIYLRGCATPKGIERIDAFLSALPQ